MSTFEDDISRVMARHDDEAPRAADLLRALEQASPPRRRPGWYVPFMVAAAVASYGIIGPALSRALSSGRWPACPPVACKWTDDLQANSASSVMPVVRQLLKPAYQAVGRRAGAEGNASRISTTSTACLVS